MLSKFVCVCVCAHLQLWLYPVALLWRILSLELDFSVPQNQYSSVLTDCDNETAVQ